MGAYPAAHHGSDFIGFHILEDFIGNLIQNPDLHFMFSRKNKGVFGQSILGIVDDQGQNGFFHLFGKDESAGFKGLDNTVC